ncbi:RDD family protein [Streptomyces sp. NPDC048717]|uniref:RDD family protein n=1 Tax=Streptomyces sp. NPDC048717 TaxID=3154928 RepID=UPI00343C7008
MATPPGGGGDVPQAGYYPDPSIPGYIRYWNGGAWVPGTSRPAPQEGETPPAPPVSGTPMPGPAAPAEAEAPATPVVPAAPVAPAVPAASAVPPVPTVEETGPLFFDEDPEPASSWQATTSGQTGFGGEMDQKVSWGHTGGADPRAAASSAWPASGGHAEPPASVPAPAPAPMPVPSPAQAPSPMPSPETVRDQATTTLKATGAPAAYGARPAASPVAASAAPHVPQPPQAPQAPHASHAPSWPVAEAAPAAAASDPARGTGTVPPQGGRPVAGAQDRPAAAAPAPARQEAAPAPAPAWPEDRRTAVPGPAGPLGPLGAGGAVNSAPAPSPWAQQSSPPPQQTRPAQPAPVAQAARPAQDAGQPPVTPWKPPVEDPFLAAMRDQTAARPAGLGRRLLARIIDGVLVGAVLGAVAYPLGSAALAHIDDKIEAARQSGVTVRVWLVDSTTAGQFGVILAAFLLLGVLYEVLPTAKWGRTLGKKLCGIQVRDIEAHEPPTFGTALRRWLVYSVLGLLLIGVFNVLWCLFDRPWRQCWHDKAARTFVAAG